MHGNGRGPAGERFEQGGFGSSPTLNMSYMKGELHDSPGSDAFACSHPIVFRHFSASKTVSCWQKGGCSGLDEIGCGDPVVPSCHARKATTVLQLAEDSLRRQGRVPGTQRFVACESPN